VGPRRLCGIDTPRLFRVSQHSLPEKSREWFAVLHPARHVLTLFALTLLILCSGVATSFAQPSLPFVVTACVRTPTPPVLDGKLDDACWQITRPMEPFGKLTLGSPATHQSTGYLLYDAEKLYIGVHCVEPRMDAVKATVTERDGPTFGDDCIEIFLIPPDSSILARHEERIRYFHFVVNTLGTRYDEIGLENPKLFDGEWEAAASRGDDSWELEIAVPFKTLGTTSADGAVWTGNLSRARWIEKEYSSWSPIIRTFHDIPHFGRFVFTSDLGQTEEQIDEIEFHALHDGLLVPELKDAGKALSAAAETVAELPGDSKAKMQKAARRLQGRLRNLQVRLGSLNGTNFRDQWERFHRRLERVRYEANDLRDESIMLAATDGGTRPWHVFITPAMTNDRLLDNRWPHGLASLPSLAMTACRGEYESATFSVYAVRDLADVRLAISDLTCGDAVLPGSCVEPFVVKCWYQAGRNVSDLGGRFLTPELLLRDDDLVRVDHREKRNLVRAQPGSEEYLDASLKDSSNLRGFVPRDADELLPLDLPARRLKQFWLTAQIPADAKPGNYTGTVTVSAEGLDPQALPLQITVLPFELVEPVLEYSIYYRGVLTPGGGGSITSEAKSRTQFAAEMRDLVAHGVTNPTIYQGYDETLLNEVFDLREAAGMKGKPVMTLGVGTGAPTTPEALENLKKSVTEWLQFIRARGYTELYVYGIDEASGDRLKAEREGFKAVHEAGGKVFVACYKDYFDVVGDLLDLPVWSGGPDPQEAVKAHSVGHRIFNYGHPQCGVEEPETYRRNFGLLLWKAGYDGAMDYAYQHSFTHEWNDFDNQSYRDHTMAYPAQNGVIGTVQWEGFREAVDDVRYLSTLLAAIESAEGAGGRKARLARSSRAWVDGLDPDDDLDAIRVEMIRRILQLSE